MESGIIKYLRLLLLKVKGASPVIREVIKRIQRESVKSSLDDYLKCFHPMLLNLLKTKKITKESYDRMFPSGTIKTDINKWDITLLYIVLYHTCSIEGKLLTNLRHLLIREVHSQAGDNTINAFLKKNKVTIESLKGTEITDEQYKTLFPDHSEAGSVLENWDNELLTTIIFKLCKCTITEDARCMVKDVVMREVNLYDHRSTLSSFLQIHEHEARIKELKDKGEIAEQQFKKVYPETGVLLDINSWDDKLLCLVAFTVCNTLPRETLKAVQGIKDLRNSLSHDGNIDISHEDFVDKWTDAQESIMTIVRESASNMTVQVKEIINGIKNMPLDTKDAIISLKNEYTKDPEENKNILDALKTLEASLKTCIKTLEEKIIQHVSKQKRSDIAKVDKTIQDVSTKMKDCIKSSEDRIIQEVTKRLENLKPLDGKDVDIKEIHTKITVRSNDDEMTDLIQNYLIVSFEVAAGLSTSEDDVLVSIRKLAEYLKEKGIKINAVTTGSVVLVLKCCSLDSLACSLKLYEKGILQTQLNDISEKASRSFGCEVHLETAFDEVGWKSILDDIEKQLTIKKPTTKGGSQKAVELTLKTASVDGLKHILETFTNKDMLKELSKELASKIGEGIHLEPTYDIDEFNGVIVSLEKQLAPDNKDSDGDEESGLIKQLQHILWKYPDGEQIIKELTVVAVSINRPSTDQSIERELTVLRADCKKIAKNISYATRTTVTEVTKQINMVTSGSSPSDVRTGDMKTALKNALHSFKEIKQLFVEMKPSIHTNLKTCERIKSCHERRLTDKKTSLARLTAGITSLEVEKYTCEKDIKKLNEGAEQLEGRAREMNAAEEQINGRDVLGFLGSAIFAVLLAPFTVGVAGIVVAAAVIAGLRLDIDFNSANDCTKNAQKMRQTEREKRSAVATYRGTIINLIVEKETTQTDITRLEVEKDHYADVLKEASRVLHDTEVFLQTSIDVTNSCIDAQQRSITFYLSKLPDV